MAHRRLYACTSMPSRSPLVRSLSMSTFSWLKNSLIYFKKENDEKNGMPLTNKAQEQAVSSNSAAVRANNAVDAAGKEQHLQAQLTEVNKTHRWWELTPLHLISNDGKSSEEQASRMSRWKAIIECIKFEKGAETSIKDILLKWYDCNKGENVIIDSISLSKYETLLDNSLKYPNFLLPLERKNAIEFIMLKFNENAVHFYTEDTTECLNMIYFTEAKDKGIILMRGEYDGRKLTSDDAQLLIDELQMFYCKSDKKTLNLLETFNKPPA